MQSVLELPGLTEFDAQVFLELISVEISDQSLSLPASGVVVRVET